MTRPSFNEAETLLGVHLQELGLYFKQGYRYVPGRKFEADFAFPDRRLLIEVQGGIYSRAAHGSITGILADNERLNLATLNGWGMFRFTPDQVKDGTAIETIRKALGIGMILLDREP